MIPVNADTLRAIAPKFPPQNAINQQQIITLVGAVLAETLDHYDINTNLRIAHFLGQVCVESAGFRTTQEFASGAEYEGRRDLGNVIPGDGERYKGRGLIQLTGRANYRQMAGILHLPLEDDPSAAAKPALSLTIACEYWKSRNINAAADRDDANTVTHLINGGYNALAERIRFTNIALAEVNRLVAATKLPDFSDVQGDVIK